MISLSTEVKRLVILAAARGSRAEIVAAIREGDGLRVLGRRTVPRAELTELLDGARVRGVEVVLGEIGQVGGEGDTVRHHRPAYLER